MLLTFLFILHQIVCHMILTLMTLARASPTFINAIIPANYLKDVNEDFDVCYFSTEKTLTFGDSPMVFVEDVRNSRFLLFSKDADIDLLTGR